MHGAQGVPLFVLITASHSIPPPSMMDNSVFLSKECESEMFIRGGIPRKQMENTRGVGREVRHR